MSDLSDLERDLSTVSTVRWKVGVLDDERMETFLGESLKVCLHLLEAEEEGEGGVWGGRLLYVLGLEQRRFQRQQNHQPDQRYHHCQHL